MNSIQFNSIYLFYFGKFTNLKSESKAPMANYLHRKHKNKLYNKDMKSVTKYEIYIIR